jgi:hypothetical protein
MTKPTFTTGPNPDRPPTQWKRWHKIVISISLGLFVLVVLIAAFAPDTEQGPPVRAATEKKAAPKKQKFAGYLKDRDVDDVKSARCDPDLGYCEIVVAKDISGFGSDRDETTEQTKEAFKAAWGWKPQPKKVAVVVRTDLVSVGGKESEGDAMVVECDRAANADIDWGNVDAEGLRTLCDTRPQIRFDD